MGHAATAATSQTTSDIRSSIARYQYLMNELRGWHWRSDGYYYGNTKWHYNDGGNFNTATSCWDGSRLGSSKSQAYENQTLLCFPTLVFVDQNKGLVFCTFSNNHIYELLAQSVLVLVMLDMPIT